MLRPKDSSRASVRWPLTAAAGWGGPGRGSGLALVHTLLKGPSHCIAWSRPITSSGSIPVRGQRITLYPNLLRNVMLGSFFLGSGDILTSSYGGEIEGKLLRDEA